MGEMEKIRDTMRSHDRVAVVEVMGRACGDIALWSAMTAPADIVLTPESPRDWARPQVNSCIISSWAGLPAW